jgi:hypothetical protein
VQDILCNLEKVQLCKSAKIQAFEILFGKYPVRIPAGYFYPDGSLFIMYVHPSSQGAPHDTPRPQSFTSILI